ncbi:hypothetical protein [Nonomuraea diastatica]|uniref:Uncharacterized protein n=1 Tax=Nonomuraea diastatica TaxID=1848329 RepID=A0A4V2YCH3_9ACTN|nr:hypothetical protein [Nonomuraea diastatica]TDD11486.1 hypothetical protein E1294_45045 [Nonomuraea diastatica]
MKTIATAKVGQKPAKTHVAKPATEIGTKMSSSRRARPSNPRQRRRVSRNESRHDTDRPSARPAAITSAAGAANSQPSSAVTSTAPAQTMTAPDGSAAIPIRPLITTSESPATGTRASAATKPIGTDRARAGADSGSR